MSDGHRSGRSTETRACYYYYYYYYYYYRVWTNTPVNTFNQLRFVVNNKVGGRFSLDRVSVLFRVVMVKAVAASTPGRSASGQQP